MTQEDNPWSVEEVVDDVGLGVTVRSSKESSFVFCIVTMFDRDGTAMFIVVLSFGCGADRWSFDSAQRFCVVDVSFWAV